MACEKEEEEDQERRFVALSSVLAPGAAALALRGRGRSLSLRPACLSLRCPSAAVYRITVSSQRRCLSESPPTQCTHINEGTTAHRCLHAPSPMVSILYTPCLFTSASKAVKSLERGGAGRGGAGRGGVAFWFARRTACGKSQDCAGADPTGGGRAAERCATANGFCHCGGSAWCALGCAPL